MRIVIALTLLRLLLHVLTNEGYGFHRDELATLSDALHLDWGYPAYPPLTPALARLAVELFGPTPGGLRLFASLAQCGVMIVTALMARSLGGSRGAQVLAALAVSVSPVALVAGHLFQYMSLDFLWSVLLAWVAIQWLGSENPRWLLLGGFVFGLGLNTRYTILWVAAGLVGGILLSPARKLLWNRWMFAAICLALILVGPSLVWQFRHDWLALDFLRTIHARDVEIGRTDGFWWKQMLIPVHLFTLPLCIAGIWFYFRSPQGLRFRPLGWAFLICLALYGVAQAREYYTAPLYPMLLAAGATEAMRWSRRGLRWQYGMLALAFVSGWLIAMPVAPPGTAWFRLITSINSDLKEEVGWPEFVGQVAAAYVPGAGILAGNYGEAGALELYGPAHGLPQPMARVNSFWLRGPDPRQPETLVVTGVSRRFVESHFNFCELKAEIRNSLGVENEETKFHRNIWLCRGLKESWPEFWQRIRAWS